jgi:hypothetical protein
MDAFNLVFDHWSKIEALAVELQKRKLVNGQNAIGVIERA